MHDPLIPTAHSDLTKQSTQGHVPIPTYSDDGIYDATLQSIRAASGGGNRRLALNTFVADSRIRGSAPAECKQPGIGQSFDKFNSHVMTVAALPSYDEQRPV